MAGEMDQTTKIVLAVVGSLGLLSTILGFSAEGTKISHAVLFYGDCYYPSNPALGLAVCAILFLVISQIIIAVVGGCYGCCQSRAIPSETNRIIVIVCAVFSWILTVIAFGLLVEGAMWNTTGWRHSSGYYELCDVLKDGIFAGAAVLTLAATALGLTSYVLLRRLPAPAPPPLPVVIATGRPQIPPQTPPKGNGHGQTPQPNKAQFSPRPTQVSVAPLAEDAPNQQFPPPAHVYEAHGSNQQFPLPDPGHGGAHASNQHPPPPAQVYAAQAPNQHSPHPAQVYAAQAPSQHSPHPAQVYVAQAPNTQFDPSTLLNIGARVFRAATSISEGDNSVDTSEDLPQYQTTEQYQTTAQYQATEP